MIVLSKSGIWCACFITICDALLHNSCFSHTVARNSLLRTPSHVEAVVVRLQRQRDAIQIHRSCRERNRSSSLFATPSSSGERPNQQRQQKRSSKRFSQFVQKFSNRGRILAERFRALSKRTKRILAVQMILFSLMFGAIAKSMYQSNISPPTIEIAYSSFLDLIDQQQKDSSSSATSAVTPDVSNAAAAGVVTASTGIAMDQIRIGPDKILYRLYPNAESPLAKIARQPKLSKRVQKQFQQQQVQPRPYVNAYTRKVAASQELVDRLRAHDLSFAAAPVPKTNLVGLTLRTFFVTFYCLILWRFYQAIRGATGTGSSAADTPGKLATDDLHSTSASFDDIQGIDQAKYEVMELVDTILNPDKYAALGARAPTGLLLEGPPGTGKTMLARATAATAGVPLLYCSGSDFVEMFVGRGAARVRKLFERASKLAPCIIFVDELDALGKARTGGANAFMGSGGGRNDEAEQTLNQLLACMDGLDSSRRICVLAATNRRDVLDTALIRPGRFDRIVKLELPDAQGREKILRVHCKKLPGFTESRVGVDIDRPNALGKGAAVDLSAIAAVTEGFSGAELEYLVNEAAIRAVRRVSTALRHGTAQDIVPHVKPSDFEESLADFYATRRPKGNSIFKNVWK